MTAMQKEASKTPVATEAEIGAFVQKAFGDIGAMLSAALVVIGDECGLYKAMAAAGPVPPAELDKRTSNWFSTGRRPRVAPCRRSSKCSRAVRVSGGTSMTPRFFKAPSGSSGRVTTPIS